MAGRCGEGVMEVEGEPSMLESINLLRENRRESLGVK